MSRYYLTHLDELESESIYVIREVAAQFENPVLLFSGGKDSIVMAFLAYKAFSRQKFLFLFCILIPDTTFRKPLPTVMN